MRALTLLVPLATPAAAQERVCETCEVCTASIDGEVRDLAYDSADATVAANTSLRESALRRFGADACPG